MLLRPSPARRPGAGGAALGEAPGVPVRRGGGKCVAGLWDEGDLRGGGRGRGEGAAWARGHRGGMPL